MRERERDTHRERHRERETHTHTHTEKACICVNFVMVYRVWKKQRVARHKLALRKGGHVVSLSNQGSLN